MRNLEDLNLTTEELAALAEKLLGKTKKNNTMVIDFYEFTMAQTYFDKGEVDREVYFDVFFRTNPFNGGYAVNGGLDNIIEYINNFKFTEEDIEYLRGTGKFTEEFLAYLKDIKFTGDIYAIPDGTPVFPNEPVITVKAPVIQAQLIETALLTNFNHGTLVTTAAKRIVEAAGGVPVMEFGARRARGEDSAVDASKYAYVAGCVGTSNTMAGRVHGVPVMGTMAHSMVCDADTEYEAFLEYAKSNPNNAIFLVDTYDTLRSGIPNAIRVAKEYLVPNGYAFKGIRIDSGDLAYLSVEARKMLDAAGFPDAGICLSNGLNEQTIRSLKEQGAKVNSFGIGDNIAAAKERVGGVYKLVAVEQDGELLPRIKLSNDAIKTINPGYKRVYRFYDKVTGYALGDVIALAHEEIPEDKFVLIDPVDEWKRTEITDYDVRELQVPIFENGVQVYEMPDVDERREYCAREFATIYPEVKRELKPHGYYVDLTVQLLQLKKELINRHKEEQPKEKVYRA